MKYLALGTWSVILLPILLLSGATMNDFQEPYWVVSTSEEGLVAAQTIMGVTSRISVASNGAQGNASSYYPSLSADGRYVVFRSSASNLVSNDTNGAFDVFIRDRYTGQTSIVSVASNGTQGNSDSYGPSLSADGRYVAFRSNASNLVSGDTNGMQDVFVRDQQTGQTTRVSVASNGTQGNNNSNSSSLSADGRYVAFESDASNLVSGDTNGMADVFVHDRQTGQTSRVSVASNGTQANANSRYPSLSTDGRIVVFHSFASNLVSGDTNGMQDVFVHDRQTGQTIRVSVASNGTQGNGDSAFPSLSADGNIVAFRSTATNLVSGDTNGYEDVFVHDRQTGQTSRVSVASNGTQANNNSSDPSLSDDGRYVAFDSGASNLVSGDTNGVDDIFRYDRQTGQTSRVSVASDGAQGNGGSAFSALSDDGRYVTFHSDASNLVSADTNGVADTFIYAFPAYVYLPFVLKAPPTKLYIQNQTTGTVTYTVFGPPEGNITCSNIPPGTTVLCGTFTPGTYTVRVDTAQCGSASGSLTFTAGDVNRPVRC